MLITMKNNNLGNLAIHYPIELFPLLFLIAIATATSFYSLVCLHWATWLSPKKQILM